MDDVAPPTRYWCHMCSQIVDPIMEVEIKCPSCQNGFVEEMSGTTRETEEPENDLGSDRSLSLWAPILLGMMNNPRSRRRMRRLRFDDDDEDEDDYEHHHDDDRDRDFRDSFSSRFRHRGDSELDREIESIIRRRRRRSSASILQLLQGIRAGMVNEFDNTDPDRDRDRDRDRESDRDRNRERDRDRVLLINPFNQTIVLRGGSYDSTDNSNLVGSLGDYFIGPGLDLLLQHLAENDPNRYGTPPAKKEDIEALPTVKVKETSQCSVCLDDFVVGTEVKEMPCKHMFHSGCILPWLELHSSCPVCRFQLAADESKVNVDGDGSSGSRNVSSSSSQGSGDANGSNEEEEARNADANPNPNPNEGNANANGNGNGNGNGRRFSMSWPFNFNSLFGNSNNSTSSSSNSHERSTDE